MTTGFDDHAGSYQIEVQEAIDFAGLSHAFYTRAKARTLLEIARKVGEPSALRALDVGCGVGETDAILRSRFALLHGTDVSEESLRQARRANPHVRYALSDGRRLPYDEASFDVVFAICVLHHVPVERRPAFARELHRVTRPGGAIVVMEHNPANPLPRLAVRRCDFDDDAVLLARREVRDLLAATGSGWAQHRYILFFPSERPLVRALERRLGRIPLGAQYASWTIRPPR